ncbi:MAG: hypothetical protein HYY24_09710 [Verrucomicrobia bacterium]|nr:hypothetical protein [Verrucomicrobiota bacterium]
MKLSPAASFSFALAVLAGFTAGSTFAADAADSEKSSSAQPKEYSNWVDLSVGGYFVNGDAAQMQRRLGVRRGAFGGIESLHMEYELAKKTTLKIDGRSLFDLHDYGISLDLTKEDLGYVRAGYREYRTWYDGTGGYYPGNEQWFTVPNDRLFLDRGEIFFEAGLRKPDVPEITIRYEHHFREGQKDSTSWSDTTLTGLTTGTTTRNIVPSFWDIDEERDVFAIDAKHKLGKTGVGLGLRWELGDLNNARQMRRRPGETQDRYLTHREGIDSDIFNVHAFTETRFNDQWLLTSGGSYTALDTDLSGRRTYGSGYDMYDLTVRRQPNDRGFLNLEGGSQINQYVLNLNLQYTPVTHLSIVPAVRAEWNDVDGFAQFGDVDFGATPPIREVATTSMSERGLLDVAESIEVRYTGLTNWVFYGRGYWLQGDGDQEEQIGKVGAATLDLFRETDFKRTAQKYTFGVNWYPLRRVSMAAQYYRKIRNDDFDHDQDSTLNTSGNRYPAFLTANDFVTDDVNYRITWRPRNNVTLVSRYDFQLSTVEMRGEGLANNQSAEVTTHILSQNATWSPLAWLYLQGSVSYTLDQTDVPGIGVFPTDAVQTSENNYWNASLSTGIALDDKTDLQATYLWYRADNYSSHFVVGLPLGAGAEEHGLTAGLSRRIRDNMRWSCKYGYYKNRDQTSGFNNNYEAHLAYTSFQYLW